MALPALRFQKSPDLFGLSSLPCCALYLSTAAIV